VPGPGSYDPAEFLTRDKSPNVKFGLTSRGDIVRKEDKQKPGPGMYEMGPKKSGTGFTIGSKPKAKN